jgi:hypothetical protein
LAEGISVAIQQLHHGSIFGLQTPFLGAELHRVISKSQVRTEWKNTLEKSIDSHNSSGPAEYF